MVKGTERVPHWSPEDPMDGAPVGLGVLGAKVQVTRARVWRDIYYVATQGSGQYMRLRESRRPVWTERERIDEAEIFRNGQSQAQVRTIP